MLLRGMLRSNSGSGIIPAVLSGLHVMPQSNLSWLCERQAPSALYLIAILFTLVSGHTWQGSGATLMNLGVLERGASGTTEGWPAPCPQTSRRSGRFGLLQYQDWNPCRASVSLSKTSQNLMDVSDLEL